MDLRNTLSTNVKILMNQKGIHDQRSLSCITGVSQSQIGNMLREDKGVTTSTLERLAQGLECAPWLLLAPPNFVKITNHGGFEALIHCYMGLNTDNDHGSP